MSKVDLRYELEFALIKWCVENDSFHVVADIISYKNFSKTYKHEGWEKPVVLYHSIVVRKMETLLFKKPITWQTLGLELEQEHHAPYGWYLHAHKSSETIQWYSARFMAMSLMELDIREKIVDVLHKHEEHARSLEFWQKADNLKKIRLTVEPAMLDIFDALDEAIDFVQYMEYQEVYEELRVLKQYLPKKVEKIKRKAQYDMLFAYLENLTNSERYQHHHLALKALNKAYIKVLSGTDLPHNLLQSLQEIATL